MGLFQNRLLQRFFTLIVVATVAVGCGDDSADNSSTAAVGSDSGGGSSGGSGRDDSGGGSGGPVSLAISGTPPSQIVEGTPIDFTPSVSNPDGVALSFSATNLPGWASLNSSTGRITGTPDAADVGIYSGIRLTVSGGGTSVTTPTYSIQVVAVALGTATLSWLPPTEKTHGSPLNDLAGYKIYYGQSQNNLNQSVTIENPGVTTYVLDDLTPATWYFAATAYDGEGMESSFSNTASKTIL